MISLIANLPPDLLGIIATHEVSREEYEQVVLPAMQKQLSEMGSLNCLAVVDTTPGRFTAGEWWSAAMAALAKMGKWRHIAIVTDSERVNRLLEMFRQAIPAELRGFGPREVNEAIKWARS
ncbi:STAS/SEC14 domain-containing protein [Nostoc ellipsosporum NOK]|nr:STAS/SEC14 domain-containing protein [Nostoc ellipsosporum NOK]